MSKFPFLLPFAQTPRALAQFIRSIGLGIALACSLPAAAQNGTRLYDIEVLVFRHLGPATLSPQAIEDYTAIAVPLAHPSEDPTAVQKPSPGMETAWRKLSNSGAMEPLWYQRWRQATSNYNRPRRYRVHNKEVLERPSFDNLPPGELLTPQDTPAPLPGKPDPKASISLSDAELKEAFRVPFPPGEKDQNQYSLDGWLSFSRQRFYHIGMELELRSIDPWGDSGDTLRSDDRIAQNRRIEIGRFEYFDTPGVAVLVRVTEVVKPDFSDSDFDANGPTDPDTAFDPGSEFDAEGSEEEEGEAVNNDEDIVD